ncbi:MAG: ATP-binding protein [Bacteroidia bacterium]|nr:ATP-binding protein [Bacteroidia bacterium]
MTGEKVTHSIEIISKADSVNIVEKLIEDLKQEHQFDEDCYGNMLVAVTEAVNNAIQHGNKFDESKKVIINYELEKDQIMFSVRDEGTGFDFYDLPDPTAPENLEKPTGRGIFLMKHLADQVIFEDNGKLVELYFKTHQP